MTQFKSLYNTSNVEACIGIRLLGAIMRAMKKLKKSLTDSSMIFFFVNFLTSLVVDEVSNIRFLVYASQVHDIQDF